LVIYKNTNYILCIFTYFFLIIMDPCIAVWISRKITNKMQPCNRNYYSKFIEGSTHFKRHTAHHQELQTVFAASGLYTHVVTGRCPGWEGTSSHPAWTMVTMVSGMPLETCWAFNKFWNNKFYYKVASCWLFLLVYLLWTIDFKFSWWLRLSLWSSELWCQAPTPHKYAKITVSIAIIS
jgi:hypothetical protein